MIQLRSYLDTNFHKRWKFILNCSCNLFEKFPDMLWALADWLFSGLSWRMKCELKVDWNCLRSSHILCNMVTCIMYGIFWMFTIEMKLCWTWNRFDVHSQQWRVSQLRSIKLCNFIICTITMNYFIVHDYMMICLFFNRKTSLARRAIACWMGVGAE